MKLLDRFIDRAIERYFAGDERVAVRDAVSSYLDRIDPARADRIAVKVLASEGLNVNTFKRLVNEATGDRFVEIFYANGDRAVISSREPAGKVGPGW